MTRRLIAFFFAALCLHSEVILPTRDGVWWYGTRTAFVGDYRWPANRPPLFVRGASGTFTAEPDYKGLTCNAAADTLTTDNRMFPWGGLPQGTEAVIYVSSGSAPTPLVSWNTDQWKRYYTRDWVGQSFKLSETPGGPVIDITACNTGSIGLSFAGYTGIVAFQAGKVFGNYTVDPVTDLVVRTDGAAHGFALHTTVLVQSTGTLPAPLVNFYAGSPEAYCIVPENTIQFRIRRTTLATTCTGSAANPTVDFTDAGVGIFKLFNLSTVLYIRSMSGMPPGTVLSWRGLGTQLLWPSHDPDNSTHLGYGRISDRGTMIFKVPANTPAQNWNVQVEVSEGPPNQAPLGAVTGAFPLQTVAVTKTAKPGPASYPSIPGYESGVIEGKPHRSWLNILTSYKNGGGAEIGGSGTGVSGVPRCANRFDAEAPISRLGPVVYGARGTATNAAATFVTIPHSLGSGPLNVQCGRGSVSQGYINLSPSNVVNNGTSATVSWAVEPNSGTSVTCWLNREQDMDSSSRLMQPSVMTISDPGSSQVWFYSDRNFVEIAKLTGDPTWARCGVAIADKWVSHFTTNQPNAYVTSPGSMLAAYEWTGNPKYKVRIQKQITVANYYRGGVSDLGAREVAFRAENRLEAELLAGVPDVHLQYFVDGLLGMVYVNVTTQPERVFNEPFITGLAARVLVRWYLLTGDERIPQVIKLLLDRFWSDWYNPISHMQRYNAELRGMRCSVNCTDDDKDGLDDGNWTGASLNALVVPAYAWYWRLTGNETYRVRGDDIFSTIMVGNADPFYAKEYSQLYYWTWDYVRWRSNEYRAKAAP